MSTTQIAGFSNADGWTFSATTEPFACQIAQGPALPVWRLNDRSLARPRRSLAAAGSVAVDGAGA